MGNERTKHTTIRQGKLAQFVVFLDEWEYNNRETSPLCWVGPSKRSEPFGAMTWWWVHIKQRDRKPQNGTFEEIERWSGRGCITAFEVPRGIKITFELMYFPDPDLFWQTVKEWEEEMDRLGFTELSVEKEESSESELASQQHATHMRDVTGPVHTGSGDIIYPTSPLPSLPLETELFLALDRWWESIKDYELSMGELGSASEANVLPQDNGMAIQLEHFRISKIKAWPFLDEETRNAFDQAEGVFLGFIAKVYGGIYGHEVYGDQVPKEIVRNEKMAGIIGSHDPSRRHTFLECRQAYRKIRAQLRLGE